MSHIRYHGVLLWNDVTIDWSSVGMWFGTSSALAAKMQAHGLVHPLFVAQTTWFGMPVCSMREEWVEHSIKGHEVHNSNKVWVGFRLEKAPMGHMKLLFSKGGSLFRDEVG